MTVTLNPFHQTMFFRTGMPFDEFQRQIDNGWERCQGTAHIPFTVHRLGIWHCRFTRQWDQVNYLHLVMAENLRPTIDMLRQTPDTGLLVVTYQKMNPPVPLSRAWTGIIPPPETPNFGGRDPGVAGHAPPEGVRKPPPPYPSQDQARAVNRTFRDGRGASHCPIEKIEKERKHSVKGTLVVISQ